MREASNKQHRKGERGTYIGREESGRGRGRERRRPEEETESQRVKGCVEVDERGETKKEQQ